MQPQFTASSGACLFAAPPDAEGGDDCVWRCDVASGAVALVAAPVAGDSEATLSLAEKLRRERLRIASTGITRFKPCADSSVLFSQRGSLWLADAGAAPRLVVDCTPLAGSARDATGAVPPIADFLPHATTGVTALVHEREVFLAFPAPAPQPWHVYAITTGARAVDGLSHGTADYISEEELDRTDGMWWSADGRWLCYQRTDERGVAHWTVDGTLPAAASTVAAAGTTTAATGEATAASPPLPGAACRSAIAGMTLAPYRETYRYPFAGAANPIVDLCLVYVGDVIDAANGADADAAHELRAAAAARLAAATPHHCRLVIRAAGVAGAHDDIYVPRVQWASRSDGGNVAVVQVLNREQSCLDVVVYDVGGAGGVLPEALEGRLLHREFTRHGWLNVQSGKGAHFLPPTAVPGVDPAATALAWLWQSERTGFAHLHAFAATSAALAAQPAYAGPPKRLLDLPAAHSSAAGGSAAAGTEWAGHDGSAASASLRGTSAALAGGAGEALFPVTAGSFVVFDVAAIWCDDEAPAAAPVRAVVLLHANEATALEKHLYAAPIAPWQGGDCTRPIADVAAALGVVQAESTDIETGDALLTAYRSLGSARACTAAAVRSLVRLTAGPGQHSCAVAPACDLIADECSTLFGAAPSLAFYRLDIRGLSSAYAAVAAAVAAAAGGARPAASLAALAAAVADTALHPVAAAAIPASDLAAAEAAAASDATLAKAWRARGNILAAYEASSRAASLVAFEASGPFASRASGLAALNRFVTAAGVAVGMLPEPHAAAAVYLAQISVLRSLDGAAVAGADSGAAADVAASGGSGGASATNILTTFTASLATLAAPFTGKPLAAAGAVAAVYLPVPAAAAAPAAPATPPVAPVVAHPDDTREAGRARLGSPHWAVSAESRSPLDLPLILRVPTAERRGIMYAALTLPRVGGIVQMPPWRTVVHVYGGPHAQFIRVAAALRGGRGYRAQLGRQGVAVVMFEGRGSYNRGVAYERPLWRRMGEVEVADQVAGVTWLRECGMAGSDAGVAIHGWSYGGYMTLLCLARHPTVFTTGVSGAPVTAWQHYDTAYTERYMGTPENNASGYEASSVLPHAAALAASRLVLVHGTLDENVHFRNTAALMERMAGPASAAATILELPGERHFVRQLAPAVATDTVNFLLRGLGVSPDGGAATATA